jgi:hypothetical protein
MLWTSGNRGLKSLSPQSGDGLSSLQHWRGRWQHLSDVHPRPSFTFLPLVTSRVIVLFPQATPSTLDPLTCWDWLAYTGLSYCTRDAPQIEAVDAMITALAKSPQ